MLAAAGAVDCVKKTLQWEGLGGLYKVRINLVQGFLHFEAFVRYQSSKVASISSLRQEDAILTKYTTGIFHTYDAPNLFGRA